MAFKDRLKEAREKAGLDQIELANKLNIRNSSISNYENGNSFPRPEIFCKIVEVLKTSPNFLYQDEVNVEEILEKRKVSIMEFELIKKYRSLDQYGKEAINSIIDIEHKRCAEIDESSKIIEKRTHSIPLAYVSLSAGKGNYLVTNDYDTIEIDDEEFSNADMAFKIDGDSMEPRYSSGDIVYIHKQDSVEIGEIGAFLYQDNQYIKKLVYEDGIYKLRSLNDKYVDIEIRDEIITYGKVLN